MASAYLTKDIGRQRERRAGYAADNRLAATDAAREAQAVADLYARLEAGLNASESTVGLLEPIASFVGAETACLRSMERCDGRGAIPQPIAALGIARSVEDAYRGRFHALDPARRLPCQGVLGPVFADPSSPGRWVNVPLSPASERHLRREFLAYQRGFLAPNGFVEHTGFCFDDGRGRTLLFDFHRGRRARPFSGLELARTRVVAHYLYARLAAKSRPLAPSSRASAFKDDLSAREFQVAAAVAEGLCNKAVAATLVISVRTVENHLRSIFTKLSVGSRTQLAAVLRGAASDENEKSARSAAKLG